MMTRSAVRLSLFGLVAGLLLSVLLVPQSFAATTLTFASAADTRVEQANAGTNYGTSTWLRSSAGSSSPAVESYLRFAVSGVSGTVQSAKLRVYVYDGSTDGPAVYTTGTSWSETSVTWNNRPSLTSGAQDDKGSVGTNVWVEFDVTPFVRGNGTFSFALVNTRSDGVSFHSREGQNKPQLIVTADGSTAPAPTATPAPSTAPTAAPAPSTAPTAAPAPTSPPMSHMEPVAPDWLANCAGNTVPFESQAWWMNDFGHLHLGFCAPQNLTISGKYTFKVRLILHDNPGKLTLLQAKIDNSSSGGQSVGVYVTCPSPGTCGFDREVTVDTAAFGYDGLHQIRVMAKVAEPDGKEMLATSFIPVTIRNGKPVQDYSSGTRQVSSTDDYVAGRGWYTNANYLWSTVFDPRRASDRVSGIYKVRVRSVATDNPQPISRFIVKLDATHTDAGTVVYDVPGAQNSPVELSIDTTKLANGWHSLLARTEAANQPGATCSLCSGQKQTHAGVTKVWFYVQN